MKRIESAFPNLTGTDWSITSPQNPNYNCIAWAASDTQRFWWPDRSGFWPDGIPRELTIDAFVMAYETLGYQRCSDSIYEPGYEKIALYVDGNGRPTHAARQLNNDKWTSKLGREHDIEHDLPALNDSPQAQSRYGQPVLFMKRRIP